MKLLPLVAIALLLVPTVRGAPAEADYPPEFLALVPGWIDEIEKLVNETDRTQPWFPEADAFLQRAHEAEAAGRLRVAIFDMETFAELALSHKLIDASARFGSAAERKTYIAQQTAEWRVDSQSAWTRYRERLHSYDTQLHSLESIELSIYASDIAFASVVAARDYDTITRDFPKQPDVPLGYVIAMVRSSHTTLLDIGWADDMLSEAVKRDGLPPRVKDAEWANLTQAAVRPPSGDTPQYLKEFDAVAVPIKENNETLLSLTIALAEQRVTRAHGMQTMFGDASSRGLDVLRDATRGMRNQLNNTTLEVPQSYGLVGIFTSDAIDRSDLTIEYLAEQKAQLGTVITAWSSLEHAKYVTSALATASPVQPPPEETDDTPFSGVALALLALACVAIVLRRRA